MDIKFSDAISLIALLVSIVASIVAFVSEQKHKSREVRRNLLINEIPMLSSELYSLLSCLKIYQAKIIKSGRADKYSQSWNDEFEKNKSNIIARRLKLRYPFNGTLIEQLKIFAKTASVAMYYVNNQELFDKFFNYANNFRDALDCAIWQTFETGEAPSKENIKKVNKCIEDIKNFIKETKSPKTSTEELIQSLDNEF